MCLYLLQDRYSLQCNAAHMFLSLYSSPVQQLLPAPWLLLLLPAQLQRWLLHSALCVWTIEDRCDL
jgi:hypothetical protein